MHHHEIEGRIVSLPLWHYEFDLRGLKTPLCNPVLANRHARLHRLETLQREVSRC